MMQAQADTVGLAKGGKPYQQSTGFSENPVDLPMTLAAAGIDDKNLAHRARILRTKSDAEFEEFIRDTRAEVKLGVERAVMRAERREKVKAEKKTPRPGSLPLN
jgi:hypothetical protein